MGLSYMGRSCLQTANVAGYNRVPDPPANIIPFNLDLLSVYTNLYQYASLSFRAKIPDNFKPSQPARTVIKLSRKVSICSDNSIGSSFGILRFEPF